MWMDEKTGQALSWPEIWSWFQPITPFGQRAKRSLAPFVPGQEAAWQESLQELECLMNMARQPDWREEVEACLRHMPDVEPILHRLERAEVPGLSEWFHLKQWLWHMHRWARCLVRHALHKWILPSDVNRIETCLYKLDPRPQPGPAFQLDDALDPELADLRSRREACERNIREYREALAREIEQLTGVRRNREGEWVVDRRSPEAAKMSAMNALNPVRETPFDVVYQAKPTPQEQEWMAKQERIEERIKEVEAAVLARLAAVFRPDIPLMLDWLASVTRFDLQWARLCLSERWNGCRPRRSDSPIRLKRAVHPVVAERLAEQGYTFTPVDLEVERGVTVIIGPNMGGKTVAMKTLGVAVALAHYGFFVPAQNCELPLVPFLAGMIGDGQDAEAGLSTFGAEMARLGELLQRCPGGLLLLDEVGRGTNPAEGAALSAAVTTHLARGEHWAVHVTHHHEVLEVRGIRGYRTAGWKQPPDASAFHRMENWREWIDYRLISLEPDDEIPRQATSVARLMGMPELVVRDAERRLATHRKKSTRVKRK
jgi:DNA mismatch repair ATPase MutS